MAPGFEPKWSDTEPHSLRSLVFPHILIAVFLATWEMDKTSFQSFCILRSDQYKCISQCVTLENALNFLEFFFFYLSNGDNTNFQDYCESKRSNHSVHGKHDVRQTATVRKGEPQINRGSVHRAWHSGQILQDKG